MSKVHDGAGDAKPPQLGVGLHHDGLHCQCAEEIQSLFLPSREKNSHGNPPARDQVGSTRKNSWSGPLQPRKTRYDGTWREDVLTSNKHPGRRTRCSLNIDATASLRVRPSSIKLKSFHLSSAHCGADEDHVLEPLRCACWRWTCQTSTCGRRDRTPAHVRCC